VGDKNMGPQHFLRGVTFATIVTVQHTLFHKVTMVEAATKDKHFSANMALDHFRAVGSFATGSIGDGAMIGTVVSFEHAQGTNFEIALVAVIHLVNELRIVWNLLLDSVMRANFMQLPLFHREESF